MPLFRCERCGVVENTALSTYWIDTSDGKPALCSQCGPEGKWHDSFPREDAIEAGYQLDERSGFLYKPEEFVKGGCFHHNRNRVNLVPLKPLESSDES